MATMSLSGAYRTEPIHLRSKCCIRCGVKAAGDETVDIKLPKRESRLELRVPLCDDHVNIFIGNRTLRFGLGPLCHFLGIPFYLQGSVPPRQGNPGIAISVGLGSAASPSTLLRLVHYSSGNRQRPVTPPWGFLGICRVGRRCRDDR